jgi:hypothetical protein
MYDVLNWMVEQDITRLDVQETNVLGFKGPRRMTIYLPALDQAHERHKVVPRVVS